MHVALARSTRDQVEYPLDVPYRKFAKNPLPFAPDFATFSA